MVQQKHPYDTLCGCRCPICGTELKVEETRKRTRHHTRYFCVITSRKGFQVIRVAQLRYESRKGDLHGISPVYLFKALLTDPQMKTLMKADEVDVLKFFLTNRNNCDLFWNSYKIAKRHGYRINNISMWCDYLSMLNNAGKDIRNPQTICPQDLQTVHDEMVERINATYRKEREEAARIREQQRLMREKENKEKFNILKSKFFGLVITNN